MKLKSQAPNQNSKHRLLAKRDAEHCSEHITVTPLQTRQSPLQKPSPQVKPLSGYRKSRRHKLSP